MSAVREQEFKLTAADGAILEAIAASSLVRDLAVSTKEAVRQVGRYYDSDTRTLEARLCALRSRSEGEGFMAAFKGKGEIVDGLSVREELECPVDGWLWPG